MFRIFFWLLPVIDVFELKRILSYYSSLGINIPKRHAQYGMLERWIGYLPAGLVLGMLLDLKMVFIIIAGIFALVGPAEFYLMYRGVGPWKFFRGKSWTVVSKIFLMEAYNAIGYYILGALIALVIT
ncbi:hypothetical protein AKJ57_04860 [candidate division MSBL1 archaeon SCGC-AAA259A05]|uniref:Uncharacterized protein n=1 Tax=candidate division MSBL1 archaeon SCGC-AAA259A05 TaxID=1698259 RepID=A0A133U6J7_9EURY|nr:hypothetical protein AKJ57_04860 [candidate division MSBL1 archaeon SCGC-AAA259A05]